MKIVVNCDVKDHAFSILKRFNSMRQDGTLCDFTIKVGTENLKVHRDILAASSDYFLAMFSHDTLEKKNDVVEMKHVSIAAVQNCVDYIYTGEFETSVEELDNLFFVVNMMQLQIVQKKLSSLLQSCLGADSFMTIRHVALKYGLKELVSNCNMYAAEHLDVLFESGCVRLFEFESMTFLLSSQLLEKHGYNEDAKLAVAVDWIKFDSENRQDKLMSLCNLLKLENISQSCGKYYVENEEICHKSLEFMKMMYISMLNDGINPVKPSVTSHPGSVAILTIVPDCSTAELYDLSSSDMVCKNVEFWKTPVGSEMTYFVAICTETQIYLLFQNQQVHVFDFKSQSWLAKQNMERGHGAYMRAVNYDKYIYACGKNTIEQYSILNNEWEILNGDKICLKECELITYKDQVLTIGGVRESPISDVNVLNPTTNSWSKFPSLIVARRSPAAVVYISNIFVVGGYTSAATASAEYYGEKTGSWTTISSACHPHDNFKLIAVRNRLYTVGGKTGFGNSEAYDVSMKKWIEFMPLKKNCSVSSLAGKILIKMKIVVGTGANDHAFSLLKRFDLMRQEGKLCDFIIKVGKEKLRVHRSILAAGSDYFFAMFSHDTLENKNGVVEMKEVSISAVGKCMDYLYTGNLETSVEELDDLFFVIDMMQLHVVRQKLSCLLVSCLNPESFLKIRCVALKYGVEELNRKCNEFAIENLDLLHESGCLSFLDFECMSFLLSSKFLSQYGYTEDAKLLVAIDWIKADIESRKDKLVALTEILNLRKVSYSCGKYFIENEEFCRTCSEFLAMMYLSSSKDAVESRKPTIERYSSQAVAILTLDCKRNLKQLYDFRGPELVFTELHLPTSPVQTSVKFTAVCDDKFWIYLFLSDRSVYGFNLKSFSWQKKQSMMLNHGNCLRATFLIGHIYVCGEGIIERYNIADEEWEVVESDNVCLCDCEVITYQGHVMTIGGTWRSQPCAYVNIFNTSSLLWSKFSSLRTARQTPAATVINKNVYVAGGYSGHDPLKSIEYYDALTCLWTVLPETIYAHDEFKLHAIQNALYTVGGTADDDIAETYDFHKKIWSVFEPLNENGYHSESIILSHFQLELLIHK